MSSDFESYFYSIYGERWPLLKKALLENETLVARLNNWSLPSLDHPIYREDKFPGLKNVHTIPNRETYTSHETSKGLLDMYFMDPGSILVAEQLQVQDGDTVLDMCAAPGGKTLVLFEKLIDSGELFANEISESRRHRLKKVIQDFIPREKRERIWVKGHDGINFGMKLPNHFDRILLDAPCSGEKHLLQNPKELKEWSKKRTEKLAQRQYGLLCSAMLALKPKGRLVYSTCSISPLENDGVIRRFMERKGESADLIHSEITVGEKTEFGRIFLPDQAGFGPLYFAILEKKA